ncbi:MAG TPA: PEGA domain-containing protein [Candidatus Eisenbacteria bacterium]|nr:PEGA domain-containing protein [Candidatus Eisenbacteria bacterium]
MIQTQLGSRFRIAGVARSPDREGALAHLDPDRGFALVARGAMGPADVIDPTIWVKEKIALALSTTVDPEETPLKRVIGALRALHAELMARPEGDRPWVAVLALLLQGGDAVAVSAGDCPCFRHRSGLLSRLGRADPDPGPHAPRGALGSEPQVRIEVVPLKPEPGDVYVLSTRPLREGEIALLARDLAGAMDPVQILRAASEGAADRGRVAVRVLQPQESESIGPEAELTAETQDVVAAVAEPEPIESLDVAGFATEAPPPFVEEHAAAEGFEEAPGLGVLDPIAPAIADSAQAVPSGAPGFVGEAIEDGASAETEPSVETEESVASSDADRPRTPTLTPIGEERAWYEPLALWGGGALAIIAVAILIRALLPGILGDSSRRSAAPPMPAAVSGTADIFSDPPGAVVHVDGVALEGRTPLTGVSLDAGLHKVELDWGPYGAWRDTVEISAATRLTLHPALYGAVAFTSSEPKRVLDVYLDGVYMGTTPLTLDQVVVGRHLVRFSGPGIATSAQEIDVLKDKSAELVGSVGPTPLDGSVEVKSSILGDAGFEPSRGDPFWVDGVPRGVTPGKITLGPGTHSVRVARRGFPPQVSILDVKSGGQAFVTAEFGEHSDEPLRFDPPDAIDRSNPLPLTITLPESEWDPSLALWLYAAPPGGTFQPKRMTRLEEGSRSYAALVPPEVLRSKAGQVRIYFMASGTSGHEIYSEIYTLPVRN